MQDHDQKARPGRVIQIQGVWVSTPASGWTIFGSMRDFAEGPWSHLGKAQESKAAAAVEMDYAPFLQLALPKVKAAVDGKPDASSAREKAGDKEEKQKP